MRQPAGQWSGRRRARLRRSLQNPHAESAVLEEQGLQEWADSLPDDHPATLVDGSTGTPVRWFPGEGWVEGTE